MFALENTDLTLLSLPSIANQTAAATDGLLNDTGYSTIIGNAIAYCQKKRAMLLLDPPDNAKGTTAIQTWVAPNSSIRDEYSALYFPRVTIADPTQNYQPRSIGPSGTATGSVVRGYLQQIRPRTEARQTPCGCTLWFRVAIVPLGLAVAASRSGRGREAACRRTRLLLRNAVEVDTGGDWDASVGRRADR